MLVQQELEQLSIGIKSVGLGFAETLEELHSDQINKLQQRLRSWGLDIIQSKRERLIEKIRNLLTEQIYSDTQPSVNYSVYIAEHLDYDYTYLSNLFSKQTGQTIQQFIIHHKIERAKQLLLETDKTLTEISFILHYSSVAHLSNQFKKVTGMTPSDFRKTQVMRTAPAESMAVAM
jgi:AraC-like DNA-binding protein